MFVLILLGALAAAVPAVDLNGQPVDPLARSTAKAVVLVFVTPDCPISNRLAPELARIHGVYSPRGVDFHLVYADPGVSLKQAQKHVRDYGYPFPGLMDPGHEWVRRTGATVTPEAVVLSPHGEVLYRGRINDRFVDFGKTRAQARRHDLRDALNAVLNAKAVPVPRTRAVGCFIPPI